jgi:hypothetical protein
MKFKDAQKRIIQKLASDDFKQRILDEDSTMLKHIPLITEINKSGYLTTESQAGRCHKGKKSYVDGKPYEIRERSYLTGFMKKDTAENFIKAMGIYTDKNAVYIPICEDSVNLPSELDIPLTITIKKDKTEINTHTSTAIPKSYGNHLIKELKLNKSEDVVCIICWDTKWCRSASSTNGLFTDVLKCLKPL